ncbi:MAG TPA: hypothetical protein VHC97_19505 [Thermoanaerobaculia bacterium]|jgi:hypothetical protein|nr:hypothetical protein [Thermoanaerobaculia bacterium]
MAKPIDDPREPEIERRDVLLWLSVLAGPFAWAMHEQVSYMLTPTACDSGRHVLLHLVSLLALLIALAGAALGWSRFKAFPEGSTEKGDPEGSRIRFMALSAATSCVFFALVILATEVPNLVLRVCD